MPKERVYWDTSVWVAWYKDEFGARTVCDHLLQDVQTGAIEIVTSAITLAEFVTPSAEHDSVLEAYLSRSGFVPVAVSRPVARAARAYCRRLGASHGLRGVDATHIASAVYAKCSALHTFDHKHLLNVADHIPEVLICKPEWRGQVTPDDQPPPDRT